MALSYYLEVATSMKPAQALERLASRTPGLEWSEDRYLLFGPTITIHATEPVARGLMEDAFHFTPTLTVGFRFVSNTDYDHFKQLMLQATVFLLEHAQDAVLLFNGEIIVLQRIGGKLVFNSEYEIWDEAWLKSRLTIPFEWRPLPSPLL